MQEEPKQADVMSHLFVPYRENKKAFDEKAVNLLAGEAHLLINAGRQVTVDIFLVAPELTFTVTRQELPWRAPCMR